MADVKNPSGYSQQTIRPNPALRKLEKLLGTWKVTGGAQGTVTFEWLEGGFFLVQHVDLGDNKGIEIIGYGRNWEGMESQDCISHYFDNQGNDFTYVYDLEDNNLTIWGGQRGSAGHYKGKFSDDGNMLTGVWEWPGVGYESTARRFK